jgi:hypothetical protein
MGADQRLADWKGETAMQRRIDLSVVVIAILALAIVPVIANAQEGEVERIIMEEQKVIPEHVFAYEAAVKEFIPLLAENGHPVPFMTFEGEDMTYYFGTQIKDLAEVQEHWEIWKKFVEKVGMETLQPHLDKFTGIFEYSKQSVWRHLPDLSYSSDPPKFDPEESPFRFWGFMYVKGGMEQQFEAAFKKFVDLFKEKEVAWGWETFVGELGTEMPVYVYAEHAPGPGLFWTEAEKVQKQLDEETMKLWAELVAMVRDVEFIRTTYRPDLSYAPKIEGESAEED